MHPDVARALEGGPIRIREAASSAQQIAFWQNCHTLTGPLAASFITELRDQRTQRRDFHSLLARLAVLLFAEAAKDLPAETVSVETPLEMTEGQVIGKEVVFVSILRAGAAMLAGLEGFYPDANVGFVGMKRDEQTAAADSYMINLPNLGDRMVFILDPMVATGGSASQAIAAIKAKAATQDQGDAVRISVLCAFAAPAGIDRILHDHPDVHIYAAVIDRALNDTAYILPGCGDAGDRAFGTH